MNKPKSGQYCRFRLEDAVCPETRQILRQITAKLEVSGEITFLSDSGAERDRFAIVEVAGVGSPLIVPVERLTMAEKPESRPETGCQTAVPADDLERATPILRAWGKATS